MRTLNLDQVPNDADLFVVTAYSPDPREAAERANSLAAAMVEDLREAPMTVRIAARAEVPASPVTPNAPFLMTMAGSIAFLLGFTGLATVLIGLKQRATDAAT